MLSDEQLGAALSERLQAIVSGVEPSLRLVDAVMAIPDSPAAGTPARSESRQRGRRHQGPGLWSRRRLAVRALLPAGGLAAVAAVTLVALLGAGASGPALAFAGWTATPARVTGSQFAIAQRTCMLGQPLTARRLRIVDVRGPYTSVVYAMPYGAGYCVAGGGVSGAGTNSDSGVAPPGTIQTFMLQLAGSSRGSYTALYGRVGRGVTGVAMRRDGGGEITATVEHGWYLVWWPSRVKVSSIVVKLGARQQLLPVPAGARVLSCGGPPPGVKRDPGVSCATVGYQPPAHGNAPTGEDKSATAPPGFIPKGIPLLSGEDFPAYRSTTLVQAYTARHVSVCFYLPHTRVCNAARLLSSLPRGYPVQQDLLQVMPEEIWLVKIPRGALRDGQVRWLITATNSGFKAKNGPVTATFPAPPSPASGG